MTGNPSDLDPGRKLREIQFSCPKLAVFDMLILKDNSVGHLCSQGDCIITWTLACCTIVWSFHMVITRVAVAGHC